jgi:hypothetical protein
MGLLTVSCRSAYILASLLVLSPVVVFLYWRTRSKRTKSPPPFLTGVKSIDNGRPAGVWIPSQYKLPPPPPYPDWCVEKTKPLPYRAFRYGPKYNVTMGLRAVDPRNWIELDNDYPKYHSDKASRIEERSEKCIGIHEDAYPATMELLEELIEYLPKRYPGMFKRTSVGLENIWSGESFNITERPLMECPMTICSRLIQDDLALMIERPDGQYYLLAGSILLPGFWRLSDKFGMPLSEIHTSGDVPHFKEKLESGMMKFFRRLNCETIYCRNNYFIQVDDSLPWSWSIGNEDHPAVSWNTAEKNKAIAHHWFRSERQSLRRLPKTGAVCFTIRTYFHPITDIAKEDYVPGRLASGIRSWDDKVANYKGREMYGEVLLEYLDNEHQKQVERGLDLKLEDDVRQYPW